MLSYNQGPCIFYVMTFNLYNLFFQRHLVVVLDFLSTQQISTWEKAIINIMVLVSSKRSNIFQNRFFSLQHGQCMHHLVVRIIFRVGCVQHLLSLSGIFINCCPEGKYLPIIVKFPHESLSYSGNVRKISGLLEATQFHIVLAAYNLITMWCNNRSI